MINHLLKEMSMTLLQLKNFLPLITYRIKIRIGEPKPFPQTQDDIVDVKRLATTGFYQIISLKMKKRLIKNSRIHLSIYRISLLYYLHALLVETERILVKRVFGQPKWN